MHTCTTPPYTQAAPGVATPPLRQPYRCTDDAGRHPPPDRSGQSSGGGARVHGDLPPSSPTPIIRDAHTGRAPDAHRTSRKRAYNRIATSLTGLSRGGTVTGAHASPWLPTPVRTEVGQLGRLPFTTYSRLPPLAWPEGRRTYRRPHHKGDSVTPPFPSQGLTPS